MNLCVSIEVVKFCKIYLQNYLEQDFSITRYEGYNKNDLDGGIQFMFMT